MWRIEVNELPPTLNKFWAGMHWVKRKEIRDMWHVLFAKALKDAKVPKPLPKREKPYQINCTQFCKRKRDADNAIVAIKLFGDVLTEKGYVQDDGPEYLNNHLVSTTKGDNKTVIIIQ